MRVTRVRSGALAAIHDCVELPEGSLEMRRAFGGVEIFFDTVLVDTRCRLDGGWSLSNAYIRAIWIVHVVPVPGSES